MENFGLISVPQLVGNLELTPHHDSTVPPFTRLGDWGRIVGFKRENQTILHNKKREVIPEDERPTRSLS